MIRKVAFTMLPVIDVPRARKFYEEMLGLKLGMHGARGDQWWIEYDLPGGGCIALSNFGPGKPAGAGATLALEVENLDELMARLSAAGVEFRHGVIAGPHCRMAPCADSEGNPLLLHQLNPD
jgi:predicted enzyme related to lactoylglutathione lyase